MKTLKFLRGISFLGLITIAICQSSEAIVAPSNIDSPTSSKSQIDQKLERVNKELREIVLLMDKEKDDRRNGILNMRKDLERIEQKQANHEEKYCNGRVAWALNEDCPK